MKALSDKDIAKFALLMLHPITADDVCRKSGLSLRQFKHRMGRLRENSLYEISTKRQRGYHGVNTYQVFGKTNWREQVKKLLEDG